MDEEEREGKVGEEEEDGDIVFQAVQYDNADFLAELLAENPRLVGAKDGNGRTGLHVAALGGHTKCAELLLQAGADIDAVSAPADSLRTPLVMAASAGKNAILALLVANGADLFYFDSDGHSALQLAQMRGHPGCAHILIEAIERLHREAKAKNEMLCAACVDGNLPAALEILSNLGHQSVRKQVLNGFGDGDDQKSALFLAAEHGRAELVAALLAATTGHSILFEPTGDTILHAAIASKDAATVAIVLRKFPFLMDAVNQEGNLPLHWACRSGETAEIVRILLEADYTGEERKFFEFPHERGGGEGQQGYLFPADLNAVDHEGRTALYLAVMEGNADVVHFLANFKLPLLDGSTPFVIGATTIPPDECPMESPFVFDTYVNGRTPLMVASANGAVQIVRSLLESGHVDANLPIALTEAETTSTAEAHCLDGSGALIEATKRGHLEVARLLFRHGAFDYGNRALGQLKGGSGGGEQRAELIGLFLAHLVQPDTERRLQKANRQDGQMEGGSGGGGGDGAAKGCRVNWAGTGLRELRMEWLVAAANRINPAQPTARQAAISSSNNSRHHLSFSSLSPSSALLATITRVDLSGNQLMAIPALLFTQLSALFHLDLSKNVLNRLELPPDGASWLCAQLEELALDGNQLEELPAQLFSGAHFPRLRLLNASANRLRRIPASVWSAPRLVELNLAENQLNELNSVDLRRQQPHHYGQLGRAMGTGAAARISRQRGKEQKAATASEEMRNAEPEERQSRSTKRESPQKSAGSSRRGSGEQKMDGGGQRHDSLAAGSEGSGGGEREAHLMEVDILRVNVWQQRIQLSNIDDNADPIGTTTMGEWASPEKGGGGGGEQQRQSSPLQVLNLAGNKFPRMPTCLACCCPRLNRLDFSRNFLSSLGPLECLPSALLYLDVSGNKMGRCFAENAVQLRQKLRSCEAPTVLNGLQNGTANQGGSMARHSRSRSKSVARSQRSLSMVRNGGIDMGGGENVDIQSREHGGEGHHLPSSFCCCLHKSHCRLEALRTLNLANNGLGALELLLPLGVGQEPGKPVNEAELTILLATMAIHGEGKAEEEGDGRMNGRRFDWKEGGELLKPYLLFPALTSLDISGNRLRQLPPVLSLLTSLAILNLSQNAELERLPPELGLLDKLWNIGLNGCRLREEDAQIQQMVQSSNYKTAEVLSQLRQKLENSIAYPKMKLMLLGSSGVGKTSLLHQMRLEGIVPKRSLQNESWSRRMGHSPVRGFPPSPAHAAANNGNNRPMARSASQQRVAAQKGTRIYPVEVAEWMYEPRRSSSSKNATADTFKGPITFRTWDFDGLKQKEQLSVQICFFTRRCLFLLLWKVTDGEIALAELQEWLIAVQERAPNSAVLIIGTHSDFVRDQPQRFPRDYLATLDQQIQERFIVGADPEKRGLPRVLGSLYLSCRSREDVKSLCGLVYACAGHSSSSGGGAGGRAGAKLKLAEKVPASFVALERVVVNMTDEMRANRVEPIMHFQQFWSAASERLFLALDEQQKKQQAGGKRVVQFRDAQDFRQACLFLHENGVLCYFDDTLLRDFVFLDPPWLCSLLHGILASAANRRADHPHHPQHSSSPSPASPSSANVHQNSLLHSTELYGAMKEAIKRHLMLTISSVDVSPAQLPSEHSLAKQFRLFRQCGLNLLRKFELALPCQNGKLSLLASFLPDEYLLRADYPGAKVRIRTKLDKLKLRWRNMAKSGRPKGENGAQIVPLSPIRNYLEHRRLSRAVPPANIENNGSEMAAATTPKKKGEAAMLAENELVKILEVDHGKEEYLRRLYVMHYVPQGFWPRLLTRLLDDERLGHAVSKLLLLSRASNSAAAGEEEGGATPRMDAVATALARALNSGSVLNLVQRRTGQYERHQNGQRNGMKEAEEEEETSFIVLNPAKEVTEELSAASMAADESAPTMVRCCEKGVEALDDREREEAVAGEGGTNGIEWMVWRTGFEVLALGTFLLSLRQFLPLASVQDLNYSTHQLFRRFEDGQWRPLTMPNEEGHQHGLAHMVELLVPALRIRLKWRDALWELQTDRAMATRVLMLVTSIIDDLLEDWYPQLGTRFVHSSQGILLVDRLIPCDRCSIEAIQEEERYWLRENINRNPAASADFLPPRPTRSASTKFDQQQKQTVAAAMVATRPLPKSKSSTTSPLSGNQGGIGLNQGGQRPRRPPPQTMPSAVYMFAMEECILEARRALERGGKLVDDGEEEEGTNGRMECPRHGPIGWSGEAEEGEEGEGAHQHNAGPSLRRMCPDLLFVDLRGEWLAAPENIRRGKMLGRGAFGFVFAGNLLLGTAALLRRRGHPSPPPHPHPSLAGEVAALKVLEPVEPSASSSSLMIRGSAQAAFRAFSLKWQNDLLEQATKAYCTARQELCMLSELAHPHCTRMLAFCARPMTLVLELAPNGSLDKILAEFRQASQRLHVESGQRASLQIARALEYLHVQQHIIYRDLKSENVLVWRFPTPTGPGRPKSTPPTDVLLKLGDYGISRFSYPSGVCKGYGGTEGFMAPEVMRYSGEQEYSERVDCFSFGMFLYELLTLRQPYEGHQLQQMKERILQAQRPMVSEKELLEPTNMLDLMVACWEERAELRPSSSQLVGICSAPEYAHLLDMALLKDGERANGDGGAVAIIQSKSTAAGRDGQQWTCWIPSGNLEDDTGGNGRHRRQMGFSLLQCSQFGWTEKKLFTPPNHPTGSPSKSGHPRVSGPPKITAIAQIYEEFLWLGDECGKVGIFGMEMGGAGGGAVPLGEMLYSVDLARAMEESPGQIVQFHRDEGWKEGGGEEKKSAGQPHHPLLRRTTTSPPPPPPPPSSNLLPSPLPFAILQFGTFPERQIVVAALPSAILLCRWHGPDASPPQLVTAIRLANERLLSMAILPSLADWQIWTGQSAGHIFMHHVSSNSDKLAFSTSASHFDDKAAAATTAQKAASGVTRLMASKCTKNLVWSVMEQDCRLFMWRDSLLQKMLNCEKILPVSESLSSLEFGGEETTGEMGHFITALELMDLSGPRVEGGRGERGDAEEQLLVGTNRGMVIVIKATEMTPISCFRPYSGPILRILECPPNDRHRPSTSRILQNELLLATNLASASPSSTATTVQPANQSKSTKKRSAVLEKSRSIMLKAAGLQHSIEGKHPQGSAMERQKSTESTPSTSIGIVRNEVRNAVDDFCEAVKSGVRGIFTGNEAPKEAAGSGDEAAGATSFFVTIGTDYRPLLNRFVGGGAAMERRQRGEHCAIFWRATKHWSSQRD